MGATVIVSDKICNKNARVRIDDVNIEGAISTFREKVSETLKTPLNTIELVYAGRVLKDDKTLSFYDIKPGVTVFALRKNNYEPPPTPAPVDRSAKLQIHAALQSALANPAYASLVERVLSNPQTLESLLAATPGLENDPVAVTILKDRELLAVLADPDLIDKVVEDHPALGHAALTLVAIINKEVSAGLASGSAPGSAPGTPRASRGAYSLDQMSDDEDEPGPLRQPVVSQPITSDQLAAALAAATGAGFAAPQAANSSSPSQPPSSSSGGGGAITTDALRLAMEEAMRPPPMRPPPAATRHVDQFNMPPPQQQAAASSAVTQEGLAALRDMGIADEEVARRALEASNGDIAAAVDIIFGNGM